MHYLFQADIIKIWHRYLEEVREDFPDLTINEHYHAASQHTIEDLSNIVWKYESERLGIHVEATNKLHFD